jgi:hypothetical protein
MHYQVKRAVLLARGYCHQNERICVLLNEVQLNEEANPLQKVLPERDVTAHAHVRMVCEPLYLPDAETCRAAFTFAKEWLGVDFDDVAEMLGASVWSQPNRLLQALEWGIGPHNILTLAAILRPGVELPGLLVTVWCETDLGLRPLVQSAWQGGAVCFPIRETRGLIHLHIHDQSGNLIEVRKNAFLHSVSLNMSIGEGSRVIELLHSQFGKVQHTLDRWQSLPERHIGDRDKIHDSIYHHRKKRQSRQLQQHGQCLYISRFEQDGPQRAEAFVRKLFNKVRWRCIIADPYFGANELTAFAFFISSINARIDLITSYAHLRKRYGADGITEGEKLKRELQRLRQADPDFTPNVTILQGRNVSPLHDRFLVIDEEVYHMGGSLNHLGHSAMAINRIPAPEPILADLERWIAGEGSIVLDE